MADALDKLGISVELRAEMDRFERNLRRAGQLVETSTGQMDKSTRRAQRQFERLEGVLDPVSRATQRLERDTRKVAAALDAGAVSESRAANVLARLNTQYETTVANQGRARTSSLAMGNAVQQAGFQVGDFAVQVASGQNPLRAFIQQGTQLVSMFGPLGAVVGAAGAIAGAFATAMLNLDDSTKKVEESTRSYNELLEFSNKLTGRAAELALDLARIRRRQAIDEARERVKIANQSIEALERERASTQKFYDDLVLLGDPGANAQFENLSVLEDKLRKAQEAAKAARLELEILLQDADGPAARGAGGAASGGGGARAGDKNGGRANRDTLPVLADDRLKKANQLLADRRQLVQSIQTPLQQYTQRVRELEAAQRTNFITESEFVREKAAAFRVYEEQREKLDGVASAADGAARAFRVYGDSTRDAAGQTENLVTRGLGHMEDALVSFSLKSKSAGEAFRDFASGVVADLQRLLIRKSITGPLADAISNFDFSGAFSGGDAYAFEGVRARAAGGPVSAGSPYLVGEKGPEIVVPRAAGTVIPNRDIGGQTVYMTLNNPTRDMVPAIIAELQKLGATVAGIDRGLESRAVAATAGRRRRDPRLFG